MTAVLRRRYGHAGAEREHRYIAKCRACGVFTSGLTSGQNARREKNDPQRTGDVYTYYPPKGTPFPFPAGAGSLVLDCRGCGLPRYASLVQGKYNPDKKCNARCLSATGTSCECSCAGKNHGAGHSA